MPVAYLRIRHESHYRHEAFVAGLQRLGFIVDMEEPRTPIGPDDIALVWNKTAFGRQTLQMAREGGGPVIVCENGYHGRDAQGQQHFAMALDGHNGSGRWWTGPVGRLADLNVEFKPWRGSESSKVLIAGQRGIGSPQMASPARFEEDTARLLSGLGYRPVIRIHPGRHAPQTPLLEDLEGCRALVVWSSNCATDALINGYPVYYAAPHIMTQGASLRLSPGNLATSAHGERTEPFLNLAWSQWSVDEIEAGTPIETLLKVYRNELPAHSQGLGL